MLYPPGSMLTLHGFIQLCRFENKELSSTHQDNPLWSYLFEQLQEHLDRLIRINY